MSDEPRRLGDRLSIIRDQAAAATARILEPDDWEGPALEEERRAGVQEMRDAVWAGIIPSRFRWARPVDFPGVLGGELEAWGRAPQGRNLVLVGPVGSGKTHAAVAAARVAFDAWTEVRFLPVVELLDLLRPGGPEGAHLALAETDLLVLDDLGSERPTDWTAERLYALVNRRWMEERPTILTSNLPPRELEVAVGARTYSRVVGSGAVVLKLTGEDRRRARPT